MQSPLKPPSVGCLVSLNSAKAVTKSMVIVLDDLDLLTTSDLIKDVLDAVSRCGRDGLLHLRLGEYKCFLFQ